MNELPNPVSPLDRNTRTSLQILKAARLLHGRVKQIRDIPEGRSAPCANGRADADGWLAAPYSLRGKTVWVAGHTGLVGGAMVRALGSEECHILTASRAELDLRDQAATHAWVERHKPGVIILAAARVGGIGANAAFPADFIYDNLMIETNVIEAARRSGVEKLLFLGSSCIYPKEAEQPIREDSLLTGPLEPTNEAYAIAKIAGIRLCQSYRRQIGCDFIAAMPCNLYGPGDRFDPLHSHVIPALMLKAHRARLEGAKQLEIWGSGRPLREFLYVDDLAAGLLFLLKHYSGERVVNIGSGTDIAIADLARAVCEATGFDGELTFDPAKPDGTYRKLLDSSRILRAGWRPETALAEGLKNTYAWYRSRLAIPSAA